MLLFDFLESFCRVLVKIADIDFDWILEELILCVIQLLHSSKILLKHKVMCVTVMKQTFTCGLTNNVLRRYKYDRGPSGNT